MVKRGSRRTSPPSLLEGVALHELTHALGRVPYGPAPDIFDLFRYSSPGNLLFTNAIPAPPAYFSVNGGITDLADYGQSSDPSDFLGTSGRTPNDPFNETYGGGTSQQLTAVDILQLEAIGYKIAKPATAAPSDFNGDGTSDILFQQSDGTVEFWQLGSQATVSLSPTIANPGTAWHEAGTGDFNGDGKSDIVFQNDDGTVAVWVLNGTSATGSIVADPGIGWHVQGTADFDGDGQSDLLLQSDDGTIEVWNMNGGVAVQSAVVGNPGASWHAVATGDFFGTGQPDILLQNDDGSLDIWQMSGDKFVSDSVIGNPGSSWHTVGVGDVDGDHKADIVLQSNDGRVAVWQMNGSIVTSQTTIGNPGPQTHAVAVGDYNGDGKADILLQNDDGTVSVWLLNGSAVTSSAVIANPGTVWQTTGQGSLHFINGTKSTGALSGTILSDDFVFTTSQQGAHVLNNFDPLHDVITLDQTKFGTFANVQSAETVINGSTVIALASGDTLTINGVLPGSLAAKNFV